MALKLLHATCKKMPKGLFIDALFETDTDENLLVSAYPTGTVETSLGPDLDEYLQFRRLVGASDYTDQIPDKIIAAAERRIARMGNGITE
jgi:hypothetical protein